MKEHLKFNSVARDILLTILTLGLWNLYVQFRQIEDVNDLLGRKEYMAFYKIILLTIITFGIYFCYHEFKLTRSLHLMNYNRTYTFNEVALALLAFLGLWFVVDSYQQSLINDLIERK